MAQTEQFTNVVWTDDCGCYLTAKVPASVITRCPMHKAAPEMLAALELLVEADVTEWSRDAVNKALAQARSQEVEAGTLTPKEASYSQCRSLESPTRASSCRCDLDAKHDSTHTCSQHGHGWP